MITALTPGSHETFQALRSWFDSPLGEYTLHTEQAILDQLLPGMFGYNLIQSSVQNHNLFDASPIQTKCALQLDDSVGEGMVTKTAELPFANDSIDVAILHHILDYVEDPQQTLREIARVTLPMGHVVIVGFNPVSLWGAWGAVARVRHTAPWRGQFIRPGRLMDWLNLLNFKIDRAQYTIYRPPVGKFLPQVTDYSQGVSRNLNVPIGSVYVIVAKKHIGAVRSIRPRWSTNRSFGRLSVVRSVKHDGLSTTHHNMNNNEPDRT